VGASALATELFGFEEPGTKGVRLAGQTMDRFLDILKYRMPRRQYEEFLDSQNQARSTWAGQSDEEESWRTPSVHIPIVFDRHPHNPQFIGRAYLPVIVNNFDAGRSWSTLRVIYMDVTSVTQAHKVGNETVYTCEIDPRSSPIKLEAAAEPLHVFLCHNSKDKPVVETILHRLAELSPLSVHPWVDKTDIVGGQNFVDQIGSIVRKADVALVFLGKNGVGPTQVREIAALFKQVTDPERKKLVILPVLLDDIDPDDVKTPDCWEMLAPLQYSRVSDVDSDRYLIRFFDAHFPGQLIL
jgi:TIR domain